MPAERHRHRPAATVGTWRRVAWAAVALGALATLALAVWPRPEDPSVAARTRRLAAELRCVDCEGLSVAESSTPSARAARADIAARIRAGQTDAQIRRAFVDRYGETVLLRPPSEGISALVWALPAAAILAGALGVGWVLWRGRRETRLVPSAEDEVLVARLRAEAAGAAATPNGSGPAGGARPAGPDVREASPR